MSRKPCWFGYFKSSLGDKKMNKKNLLQKLALLVVVLMSVDGYAVPANPKLAPVVIGFDGEFGYQGSTSAEGISAGIKIAMTEINQAGGVLGGRPLTLVEKANHSVPARSIANIKQANNPCTKRTDNRLDKGHGEGSDVIT